MFQLIEDRLDVEVDRQVPGPTIGTEEAAHATVYEFKEDEKPLLVISKFGNRKLRYEAGRYRYPANLERDQEKLIPDAVSFHVILVYN
jgi:hypothetical protein